MARMTTQRHPDRFVNRHIGPDAADIEKMLEALGLDSLDQLVDRAARHAGSLPVKRPSAKKAAAGKPSAKKKARR